MGSADVGTTYLPQSQDAALAALMGRGQGRRLLRRLVWPPVFGASNLLPVFTWSLHVHKHSTCNCESASSVDLGVTNKLQWVDRFANMESTNNEGLVDQFLIFFFEPASHPVSSFITKLNKYLIHANCNCVRVMFWTFLKIKIERLTLFKSWNLLLR